MSDTEAASEQPKLVEDPVPAEPEAPQKAEPQEGGEEASPSDKDDTAEGAEGGDEESKEKVMSSIHSACDYIELV